MKGFNFIFRQLCFHFVLLFFVPALAQERYVDSLFADVGIQTFNYSDTLQLDVYSPKNDKITDRPLLLLVHGGGFAIGKRDNPLEKKFSTTLAKKGYVTASMSYRLTRKGKSFSCDCPADEKLETFKLVTEDVLNATNYLIKNATSIKFNPDKIILVGSSAGAEAVLNTVYMRYHRDFRQLPYGEPYFAGVVSFAGAVLNVEYITKKNAVPALLFHGAKDRLVPFGTAPHHFCDDSTPGFLPLDGSKTIAEKLTELNVPFQLYHDPKGNHDWANIAYDYTDEVAHFVKAIILNGQQEKSTITITSNPQG
ncbi:alpha/beta hydrolase [Allomuricauda sp. d1]|uniref:alpha/beta hydrolase n=1 Tax=Allomuricauda sp. d1 TaxID=3136725 RepID=UPI0031DFAF2C